MDFEYRLRARTMRLLALSLDRARYAREGALQGDQIILDLIAAHSELSREEITTEHVRGAVEARAQFIGERGDPDPLPARLTAAGATFGILGDAEAAHARR